VALVVVGQRAAAPSRQGQPGWVRSRAWTWLFASTARTNARSGGSRYSPTTSRSFSTNCGSRESLKVSTRCGCSHAASRSAGRSYGRGPGPGPACACSSASPPRCGVQRRLHDPLDHLGRDGLLPAGPWRILQQPRRAPSLKPAPPQQHRRPTGASRAARRGWGRPRWPAGRSGLAAPPLRRLARVRQEPKSLLLILVDRQGPAGVNMSPYTQTAPDC